MSNNTADTQPRPSLAVAGLAYFGAVLLVGLPVMYLAYTVFAGTLAYLRLDWFVSSVWGVTVLAAAVVVGIWAAGNVAQRGLNFVHERQRSGTQL